MTVQLHNRPSRPGRRGMYAGLWLNEQEKRRLLAMSALRGKSQSDVLRDLITGTPLEPSQTAATEARG